MLQAVTEIGAGEEINWQELAFYNGGVVRHECGLHAHPRFYSSKEDCTLRLSFPASHTSLAKEIKIRPVWNAGADLGESLLEELDTI